MAWKCFMVEEHTVGNDFFIVPGHSEPVSFKDLPIGAMWFEEDELCVKLPDRKPWNIDRGRKINASYVEHGSKSKPVPQWSRTGTPPLITVTPSVNCVGRYHGWVRDGVITDDCEGRSNESFGTEPGSVTKTR